MSPSEIGNLIDQAREPGSRPDAARRRMRRVVAGYMSLAKFANEIDDVNLSRSESFEFTKRRNLLDNYYEKLLKKVNSFPQKITIIKNSFVCSFDFFLII